MVSDTLISVLLLAVGLVIAVGAVGTALFFSTDVLERWIDAPNKTVPGSGRSTTVVVKRQQTFFDQDADAKRS